MKKLLFTAFAAVSLAAFAAPASAIDFGGEIWVKGEYRDNANFHDQGYYPAQSPSTWYDDTDQAYVGQRTRLWGVAKPTDDTTVKVTIQDTRFWGINGARYSNGGPYLTDEVHSSCSDAPYVGQNEDESIDRSVRDEKLSGDEHCNGIDMHEAWLQVDNFFVDNLSVKVGRQELNYGDQRLIGAFGWNEHGRSFDAIKATYKADQFSVDLFASKIADGTAGFPAGFAAGDTNDRDQDFFGIYGTVKVIPNNTLDLYALWLRDGSQTQMLASNQVVAGTISETQNLYTLGARLAGNYNAFDYTLELPIQQGDITTNANSYDIDAHAFAAKVGFTLPTTLKIRVGAEYNMASGDNNANDGTIETFSNLFPTNHGHMGHMDNQAWRNMEAIGFNVSIAEVIPNLSLYGAYWVFELAEEKDGWYGAGNWMNGAGNGSSANQHTNVGSELDLSAKYKYNSNVTLEGGWSIFMVDDYIQNTLTNSNDKDQHWGWVKVTGNY